MQAGYGMRKNNSMCFGSQLRTQDLVMLCHPRATSHLLKTSLSHKNRLSAWWKGKISPHCPHQQKVPINIMSRLPSESSDNPSGYRVHPIKNGKLGVSLSLPLLGTSQAPSCITKFVFISYVTLSLHLSSRQLGILAKSLMHTLSASLGRYQGVGWVTWYSLLFPLLCSQGLHHTLIR